jgi:hypothetical protein
MATLAPQPLTPVRGTVFAILAVLVFLVAAFLVWTPHLVFVVIAGWVTGFGLVWVYARGAGAPVTPRASGVVVGASFAAAMAVAVTGSAGAKLRELADQFDLGLLDLIGDRYLAALVMPALRDDDALMLGLLSLAVVAAAALVGIFQALAYMRSRVAPTTPVAVHASHLPS